MTPVEPGIWYTPVAGATSLRVAAGLLNAAPPDRWRGDAARAEVVVLVPDSASRRVLVDALMTSTGALAGAATGSVWTPATLYRQIWPQAPSEAIERSVLIEAGRAVDAAIRLEPGAFPNLANAPVGPTMARAYATLLSDFGRAGAHSRSPGAVAALEQLRPDGMGQELLMALGMMEGCQQRIGSPARWEVAAGAAARLRTWRGPARWIVAGFDGFEQSLTDILRGVAVSSSVTILVPAPGPAEGSALARGLEWLGAAPTPELRVAEDGRCGGVIRTAGPADAAHAAADLAGPSGLDVAVALVPDPARWRPMFEEVCARRGWWLGGDTGGPAMGWAMRFVVQVVRAWRLGLTSARAVDLIHLGSRMHLGPTPSAPPFGDGLPRRRRLRGRRAPAREPWDRLDAQLRARGVRRDRKAIVRAGGPVAQLVASVFGALDNAEGPAERLLALAALCRDLGFWRRCLSAPALIAGRETAELARLANGAEELARRLDTVWPESLRPVDGREVFVARVMDLVAAARRPATRRTPPGSAPTLWLHALEAPLPAGAEHVILVGLTEAAVERAGRSGRVSSLIPDAVRSHPAVASLVNLPLARDKAVQLVARLHWLLSGRAGCGVDVIVPHRDLRGEEQVVWDGARVRLGESQQPPALPRAAPLRPRPVARAPTANIMGGDRGVAATVVDAYRACPRRFYFERVLQVRDRDAVEFDIDSRQRGNWLHALMHTLFRDEPEWWRRELEAEAIADLLKTLRMRPRDRLITGASDPFLGLQRSALIHRVSGRLVEHAELLNQQAGPRGRRHTGMAVVGLELSMRGASGVGPLVLRGTLDRLDIVYDRRGRAVGTVVVDYKTGRVAPYGLAAPEEPQERLQLLLYAHLAERVLGLPCLAAVAVPLVHAGRPRGIVLADPSWPAAEAWVEVAAPADVVDKPAFDEAIEASLEETQRIVEAVGEGIVPATPGSDRECGLCTQSLYCDKVRR